MTRSYMSGELDRLATRFEIAVENFFRSAFELQANEAAYQAWYAASVIAEFGLSRVYREVHLSRKQLADLVSPDYVESVGEDRLSWWTRWTTQQCRNCGTRSAYRQWQRELVHRDRQHKTFRYRCPECNESFLKTESVGDGGFFGGAERPPR